MPSQYHFALAYIISYLSHVQYPPSTRPLPTWTKHRHDDLRIPVPTFAPATETIYDLDSPLAPTGHQFHGVLGDLPPDHIIPASISRRMPHGMPHYHRERPYFITNIATRTFPRDVSCIRLGVVARQPVHWPLEFPWLKLRDTVVPGLT